MQATKARVAELESRLKTVEATPPVQEEPVTNAAELEALTEELKKANERADVAERTIEEGNRAAEWELTSARADAQDAVERAENLQHQIQDLRKALSESEKSAQRQTAGV